MQNMTRFVVNKNENYTTISNGIIRDKNISFKAKAVFLTVMSLPPSWELSINGLTKIVKEGKSVIQSGIKELIEAGYCERKQIKINNRFAGYEYSFYEDPQTKITYPENQDTGNQDTENQPQLNTKELNKEKQVSKDKSNNNILVQFDKFWDLYDKKVSKEKTLSKFKKLNDSEIEKLFEVLPKYIEATPDKQYRKNPDTYLHNKCFNDEIIYRIPNERNKTNTGNNKQSDFRVNFVETLENSYKINPDLWTKNSGDTESDTEF